MRRFGGIRFQDSVRILEVRLEWPSGRLNLDQMPNL